jgi:hypothetical protein
MIPPMATIPLPVDLPAEACKIALGPAVEGLGLRPQTRAAIERAAPHALSATYCTVTCTAAEAQDLLAYFRSAADVLGTRGDARASVCAVAADNLRLALRLAGEAGDTT